MLDRWSFSALSRPSGDERHPCFPSEATEQRSRTEAPGARSGQPGSPAGVLLVRVPTGQVRQRPPSACGGCGGPAAAVEKPRAGVRGAGRGRARGWAGHTSVRARCRWPGARGGRRGALKRAGRGRRAAAAASPRHGPARAPRPPAPRPAPRTAPRRAPAAPPGALRGAGGSAALQGPGGHRGGRRVPLRAAVALLPLPGAARVPGCRQRRLTRSPLFVSQKRRGVDHGPATLRAAGLVERLAGLGEHSAAGGGGCGAARIAPSALGQRDSALPAAGAGGSCLPAPTERSVPRRARSLAERRQGEARRVAHGRSRTGPCGVPGQRASGGPGCPERRDAQGALPGACAAAGAARGSVQRCVRPWHPHKEL